jgi:hypothetical protein
MAHGVEHGILVTALKTTRSTKTLSKAFLRLSTW